MSEGGTVVTISDTSGKSVSQKNQFVPGAAERSTTAVLVGPPDGAAVSDDVGLDATVSARQLPSSHASRGKRGDLRRFNIEISKLEQFFNKCNVEISHFRIFFNNK